jgi:tetratricopeptide (TPR) repeat protein
MTDIDVLGPTEARVGNLDPVGDEELGDSPVRPIDTAERQLDQFLRVLPMGAEAAEPESEPKASEPLGDAGATGHLARLLQGVRGDFERGTAEPTALRGRTLDRYLVLGKLGQGGMGTVLKAYDESLDRAVAIKLLHAETAERHAMRLKREAQALAKLSHPNIVHVYEVGETGGQWFIAMELVPGQTLRQWQQDEARSWKDCVKVYLQAGEGLAAAHAVGLVHRDFKPDNCIIDGKGRPKVLDFGLVGGTTLPPDEAAVSEPELEALRVESVDASLTSTGTVMGTPAYMPPEQMNGLVADARSDQFSFCVALYEAVYGERPFEGPSMLELSTSMADGRMRPAPKGTHVPKALRRVLVRGLAVDPALRWPSMEALLEALRPLALPRRGRWIALSMGVGVVAVGAGLAAGELADRIERCSGARAQLEGIWDDVRRQEVGAAILGTKLSYAPATWQRVEQRLDDYADAWAQQHTEACEATRARGEQSEQQMSLRMGCLAERRLHVRATVNELARADTTTVENAVQAVTSLPRLERCSEMAALEAEIPPPEDPAMAERVAELDEQLVEAKARQNAGRYANALALVDEVAAEAATLDYEPLMARAWLEQGKFRYFTGDFEASATALRQAFDAALAQRMTDHAAKASTLLVGLLGGPLARHEEARRWAVTADPLARAVGTDEAQAGYFNSLGNVARLQGKLDEARDSYERALAGFEKAPGPDHLAAMVVLDNLGITVMMQGKLDEARCFHERALAIWEKVLGPDHPATASSLDYLGRVAKEQGKLAEARNLLERALAIREEALGPGHPDVAHPLYGLGKVAEAQGKLDEARRFHERALAIAEKAFGPDHPHVAFPLTGLGETLLELGMPVAAIAALERALTIRSPHDVDPSLLAETRFALARGLWTVPVTQGRDRPRARMLAEQARDAWVEGGAGSEADLAKAEAWLAEHRLR